MKLKDIYIQRIIKWAKNKPTSDMIWVAEKFSNILKKHYGRPKKFREVFYISKKDKEKRYQFCKTILEKENNYNEILLTDESKISMGSYTHDYIRLDPSDQLKLKAGKRDIYTLLNRPQHKFEQSLIIAWGILYNGITKLIIIDGTMNNFAYGKKLLFYEEDMKNIKIKIWKKINSWAGWSNCSYL